MLHAGVKPPAKMITGQGLVLTGDHGVTRDIQTRLGRPEGSSPGCASSDAGLPDSEFGAFRCAPAAMPTPRRSTSSPPSQPVSSSSAMAKHDIVIAAFAGT